MLPELTIRPLREDERRIPTGQADAPVVMEPNGPSEREALRTLLVDAGPLIARHLERAGAVLLRGFGVDSDLEFQRVVCAVKKLHPISEAFMAERGRNIVSGTKFVLHTSSLYKTGGTLAFGWFHSENYYSPDVPHFIGFNCHTPPTLGGETGLVHLARAYRALDRSLQEELEAQTFPVAEWPLSSVAARYEMSESDARAACLAAGLTIQTGGGGPTVVMCKPSVIEHPATGAPALLLNFGAEVPGLQAALFQQFASDYSGKPWRLHRAAVRHPWLAAAQQWPVLLRAPALALGYLRHRAGRQKPAKDAGANQRPERVGSAFSGQDVECLAQAMRQSFTSFTWKRGDVLLVDNLQMAHAGMPGSGPRLLRAIICNPVRLNLDSRAPGRQVATCTGVDDLAIGARLRDRPANPAQNHAPPTQKAGMQMRDHHEGR